MPLPVGRPPKAALLLAQHIIRDATQRGLGVGDALATEQEMAASFGVGRATVREALRILELQGVIAFRVGRHGGPVLLDPHPAHLAGAMALLMQLSRTPFREAMEVRAALEPLVASLAATRIDDRGLADLARSVRVMEECGPTDSDFWVANRAFHSIIAEASGNHVFWLLVESVLCLIDSVAAGMGYPEERREQMLDAHRRILEPLRLRDPGEAAQLMLEHMSDYEEFAEDGFPDVLSQIITWTPHVGA